MAKALTYILQRHSHCLRPCRQTGRLLRLLLIMLCMVGAVLHADAAKTRKGSSNDGFFSGILNGSMLNVITDHDRTDPEKHTAPPLGIRYTKKHPLIIVGDWNFKPYSYINDEGEADGFIVRLMEEIFSRMHVPYEIHLMEWKKARQEVQSGRAQVMVDIFKDESIKGVYYGKETLAEYEIGVMHRKDVESLRSIHRLTSNDTIYCNGMDYAADWLDKNHRNELEKGHEFQIETKNPYLILGDILSGKVKYYVWSLKALQGLKKTFDSGNDIEIDELDVPAGQFRFYCSDPLLSSELDAQFCRLVDSGLYDNIHDKWLSDDGEYKEGYSAIDIALIIFLIMLAVFFVFFIVLSQRGTNVNSLKQEFETLIGQSEDLTTSQILAIEVGTQWVHNVAGTFLPPGGMSVHDYEQLVHPEDRHVAMEARGSVDGGEVVMPVVHFRIRHYNSVVSADGMVSEDWHNMAVHANIRTNRSGKADYIYLSFIDETEQLKETAKVDRILREYAAITDVTDLGMIYYDRKGNFVNANDNLFRMLAQGKQGNPHAYMEGRKLQQLPVVFNEIKIETGMDAWVCTRLNSPELNLHIPLEVGIQGIVGDNGENLGYSVCVRDLSYLSNLNSNLKRTNDEFIQNRQTLSNYQNEMRQMLRQNNMRTFRWRKGNDYIERSSDLLNYDTTMPLSVYLRSIRGEKYTPLDSFFSDPNATIPRPTTVVQCYANANTKDKDVWIESHYMPEYDKMGNYLGIFGVTCDISQYIKVQNNLREQTEKANDSGRQKTVFLANMTHELRTPLNAVNGFAEILKLSSTPEEKAEYVNIMMHSCTMLISMVDNILQLSMIDTEGIKLHLREVDFAVMFSKSVKEMKRFINSSDVELQFNRTYSHLMVTIDYDKVMQIIETFVNNASKYTTKGFIRLGYRYKDEVLTIYCRDTGCGIPLDKQQEIFNRFVKLNDFVQGTGLGLSVSKAIADAMGAKINIYSEEGKGSTFSLAINLGK